MTNWRDTIMTHTEMRDRIDELQSLLAIARENEERTAAANRELVSRLDSARRLLRREWDASMENVDDRIAIEAARVVERHDSNG